MKFNTLLAIIITFTLVLTSACRNDEYIFDEIEEKLDDEEEEEEEEDDEEEEEDEEEEDDDDDETIDRSNYPDWSDETHSNDVDPDYSVVFAQGEVLRIDITMSSSSWSDMWSDLSTNLGSSSGGGFGNMGGNMTTDVDFTPIWVPCTLRFNDKDWYEVGIRFKGNSSLSTNYYSGNQKMSFKLDFDEYEDDYPALKNQRFYGFKQLNLNCNYEDESLMREKCAGDLFRAFGIAAAQTAFCVVYIDYGSGSEYFGVYTIVEEVDDTLIKDTDWFSDSSGNLYKPEDDAASFKSGTYDTSEFYLKTNTSSPNYSDVKSLYDALHDSSRTSNSSTWQAQIESVFNVDRFIKWLAANTAMQNWDTYGSMAHNYFIYTNPSDGLITWIPWDNNEALQSGNSSIEVSAMSRVSSSWPLISYLYDIAEYEALYKSYLKEFVDEVFVVAQMQALYTEYYDLLKDYAYAEESGRTFISPDSEFDSAVSTLKTHVQSRNTVVNNYVK